MNYRLYLYINQEDIRSINEFFHSHGVDFFDKKEERINELPAITKGIEVFYSSWNEEKFIEYMPCYYTLKYIQAAYFRLENPTEDSRKLFFKFKKYIQNNSFLSSDKSFYIGKSMYLDWINRTYFFPVLFHYKEFYLEEKKINDVFNELAKMNYKVKNNNVRLRNMDVLDLTGEAFVIFFDSSDLITTVVRNTILNYDFNSQCIFVYYRKRQRKYVFHYDQRNENTNLELTQLFKTLREKWSDING